MDEIAIHARRREVITKLKLMYYSSISSLQPTF
jgi:hypothetical protein